MGVSLRGECREGVAGAPPDAKAYVSFSSYFSFAFSSFFLLSALLGVKMFVSGASWS